MSRFDDIIGIFKMLVRLTRDEWDEMDHKFMRLAAGAIGFLLTAAFWYVFFRNSGPF